MSDFQYLPLNSLEPDPDQPRKDFDPEKLQELADSISAVGVKQPISVRKHPSSQGAIEFMIIAGERRWRASKLAGKDTIPSVIVTDETELTDDALYAHQLTENLHRQDLNPVEKAEFIQERIDYLKNTGVTNAVDQVSQELGVSPSWISKNTAILKYEPEIRSLARDGKIRDYSLIKKISKLKGQRREEALNLIESGEFNANDFFKRKRYDKKKPSKDADGEGVVSQEQRPTESQKPNAATLKVSLSAQEWVNIIERTDYASMLDRHDEHWRNASTTILKEYIGKFREWLSGTSA